MKLIELDLLKPHEQINAVNFSLVAEKITGDQRWFIPIIIDRDTGIIMDGHHRYNFALQSGFKRIPCYKIPYSSDLVRVYHRQTGKVLHYETILNTVLDGGIFPAKTTHHIFSEVFDTVNIEFSELM